MNILFIANPSKVDYQCHCLFHGLHELKDVKLFSLHLQPFMYSDYPKEKRCDLYGMGFTITGLIDPSLKNVVNESQAVECIESKFFDAIIYGHIHRCQDLWDIVVDNYPRERIICIDGEDWSMQFLPFLEKKKKKKKNIGRLIGRGKGCEIDLANNLKRKQILNECIPKSIFFKRELDVSLLPDVHPISFAIPACKIVDEVQSKTRRLAFIRPGELDTYIYKTESDYYKGYQESKWGLTFKKGGWDCLRHYEILANGCVPYFPDLSDCPNSIMTNFPKQIISYTNLMFENNIDGWEYNYYVNMLLDYTRENLTTVKLAKQVLFSIF